MPRPRTWSGAALLLPAATAIVIVAVALLLLMSPYWMHFALDVSGGSRALPTPQTSFEVSDRTVVELFVGPGTFSSFSPDEASHMRDVRLVLWGFLGVALAAAAVVAWQLTRGPVSARTWRAVARGGVLLAVAIVVAGVFATVAFGLAFELFHRIVFPGGNWSFAADSLLIRLYPYEFWQLSAAALGLLAVAGGFATWWFARGRARAAEAREVK